jgi:hypothetical protein
MKLGDRKEEPMTPEDLENIDFPPLTEIRLLAAKGGGILLCSIIRRTSAPRLTAAG